MFKITQQLFLKTSFSVVSVFLMATTASAQVAISDETNLRATHIIAQWNDWLERHDVSNAAIAVSFRGQLVAEAGAGARNAREAYPIASVSKSITGVCLSKLAQERGFEFNTLIKDLVPQLNSSANVGSLLNHTSGYSKDVTQRSYLFTRRDREYLYKMSKQEIAKGRKAENIGIFRYNNANYAILGAVIKALTDMSYERACQELVFEPIGVDSAELNPRWRVMSAWGGWKISAVDHLKFVASYFDDGAVLGKSPMDLPNIKLNATTYLGRARSDTHYGMGYLFGIGRNGGFDYWHEGAWLTNIVFGFETFGAFFIRFDNGWAISMNHEFGTVNNELDGLAKVLSDGAYLPIERLQ